MDKKIMLVDVTMLDVSAFVSQNPSLLVNNKLITVYFITKLPFVSCSLVVDVNT